MEQMMDRMKYNYKVTAEFEMIGTQEYKFIDWPGANEALESVVKAGTTVRIEKIAEEI